MQILDYALYLHDPLKNKLILKFITIEKKAKQSQTKNVSC